MSRYVAALKERHGDFVQRVVVYGSRARGEGGPDSDLDLLVVVRDGDWRLRFELLDLAGDLDQDHVVLPSVQVFTEEEWADMHRSESVYREAVERDGIAVA